MTTAKFFLQGAGSRNYTDALNWLITWPSMQSLTFSAAFVTEKGVQALEPALAPVAHKAVVVCGVRNPHTTYAGVRRLLELGVVVYAIDTGTTARIYHPKFYLADSGKTARLLIGSGNLTEPGLTQNLEAGLELNLDRQDSGDLSLLGDIQSQLNALLSLGQPLVNKLKLPADLDGLKSAGAFDHAPTT